MTFNQSVKKHTDKVSDILIKKMHDYSPQNILGCPVGAEMGVIVRLYDKLNRLANLYKTGKVPSNESINETFLDIAGYGLIGMMLCNKEFDLPLE